MTRFREVLFQKNFFFLWSGQIISEFGDRLNQMALIALIYSKHPGSVMALANLLMFTIIPVFLIGPVAGVYVDRWDRRRVMIISDLLRGVLVLLIPLCVMFSLMLPVYVVIFIMFSATRFFLPSKMALIPAIVSREQLLVANSLANTTRMLATIFGFALAGFLVQRVGHMWGFYLDSLSYFISAILISRMVLKGRGVSAKDTIAEAREVIEGSIRRHLWAEIKEGFRHMVEQDRMKAVTGIVFLLMAGTGAVFCVIIVFVQEAFGTVTADLGILGVFLGGGLLAGTVLFGKFGQALSRMRTMFGSLSLCGFCLILFVVTAKTHPILFLGAFLIFVLGAAAAPILTCVNTLMHSLVPDEARGRIFSSMEVVIHLAFLLFMLLTAYLAVYIDKFYILLGCGIVFIITGAAGYVTIRVKGSGD
ncbi:MAG: MFS transporter [Candidatus Tantalella remota]|nr:MFS transporter [Candidatus Tantalella remota]